MGGRRHLLLLSNTDSHQGALLCTQVTHTSFGSECNRPILQMKTKLKLRGVKVSNCAFGLATMEQQYLSLQA